MELRNIIALSILLSAPFQTNAQEVPAGARSPIPEDTARLVLDEAALRLANIRNIQQYPAHTEKLGPLPVGAAAPGSFVWVVGSWQGLYRACPRDFSQLEVELRPFDEAYTGVVTHSGPPEHCAGAVCELQAGADLPLPIGKTALKWRARMLQSLQWQTCDVNSGKCSCIARTDTARTSWTEFAPGAVAFVAPQVYRDGSAELDAIRVTGGQLLSGAVGNILANDNNYVTVRRAGVPKAPTVELVAKLQSKDVSKLWIAATSRSTRACTQRIEVLRVTDGRWMTADQQSVGTTRASLNDLIPPGKTEDYVQTGIGIVGSNVSLRISCDSTSTRSYDFSLDFVQLRAAEGVYP